jgi:hypothetical protein
MYFPNLWLCAYCQCANTGFHLDPNKVSFSCRIASNLRSLPEGERPNLIALLKEYGDSIEGFRERVGDDFARGHKEATGGIIAKVRETIENVGCLVLMALGGVCASARSYGRTFRLCALTIAEEDERSEAESH